MATIILKNSNTQSSVPTVGDLTLGELAVNTYDGKIYLKKNDGVESVIEIGEVGGGATEINDLSDVNVALIQTNDVLSYDGANWSNTGDLILDTVEFAADTDFLTVNSNGFTGILSCNTLGGNRTWSLPNSSGTLINTSGSATLSNKTINNTSSATLLDTNFTLQDDGDNTKQAQFNLANIPTGVTRTFSLPSISDALAGRTNTQTFENKTITSAQNTLTIDIADLDTTGTANSTTFLRGDGQWSVVDTSSLVTGPASATDNAVVRYDGTTGKLVQDSSVIISNNGDLRVSTSDATTGALLQRWTSEALRTFELIQPDGTNANSPFIFQTNNSIQFEVDNEAALTIDSLGQTIATKTSAGASVENSLILENATDATNAGNKIILSTSSDWTVDGNGNTEIISTRAFSGATTLDFHLAPGSAGVPASVLSADGETGLVTVPNSLQVGSTPAFAETRNFKIFDNGVDGGARMSIIGTTGNLTPAVEFVHDGNMNRRCLIRQERTDDSNFGTSFYQTAAGTVTEAARFTPSLNLDMTGGGSVIMRANGNQVTLSPAGTLSGSRVATFPNATGTVVLNANSQTLTNKTINGNNNTLTVLTSQISASGTANSSTFLRGDGQWASVPVISNLNDIGDVTITTPADGEVLTYNSGNWENQSLPVLDRRTETFSGNGATTSFAVTTTQTDKDLGEVFIAGVHQPRSTWNLSGGNLVFLSGAPETGTNNIELTTIEITGAASVAVDNKDEYLMFAVSDETTDLTTGTAKLTFRMPYAMTLTAVRASVSTAPTGAAITVDINETGASILSTKLTIDATETTSTTAATAAVISDANLADDAEITIDIDTVGSTVAGAGLKVTLIGNRV